MDADVIVVGAGLAGLAATAELADAGRRVVLVEQQGAPDLGGQAHWSFGGLFLVDSPEQRRMGIRDGVDLAWQDWQGAAAFDREREDRWPRRWARAYLDFAAGEKRPWLHAQGVRFFPIVNWAERGGHPAGGHGNSVPRFHVVWGTGPGLVEPFARRVAAAVDRGIVRYAFGHRVDGLTLTGGTVDGVRGSLLADRRYGRGESVDRPVIGEFTLRAQAVVVTTGGIGGNHDLVRANWPDRLGRPPADLLTGVPAHVDGRMIAIAEAAGANVVNRDRMWHYPEGITNPDPVWPGHGIRILAGPSSLWLDAAGRRLPPPLYPGYDALGVVRQLAADGHGHSWFVLTRRIVERELVLSGSEQNPDLTGRSVLGLLARVGHRTPGPVANMVRHSGDFVVSATPAGLAAAMAALVPDAPLDPAEVVRQIRARDLELANPYGKDPQLQAIRAARRYPGDRLIRVATPHRFTDPDAGPLVAVRLRMLTRKTLGGLETDLDARVLRPDGEPLPGLYAAGEVAGFGGGGMHGYRALEGSFLGGCLFSGRTAGRAAARGIA